MLRIINAIIRWLFGRHEYDKRLHAVTNPHGAIIIPARRKWGMRTK